MAGWVGVGCGGAFLQSVAPVGASERSRTGCMGVTG
eukprot:gene42417-34947_t